MVTVNPWYWLRGGLLPSGADRARWKSTAKRVIARSTKLHGISDEALLRAGRELKWKAQSGIKLKHLLPEAYALVRESAHRALNMETLCRTNYGRHCTVRRPCG